MATTSAPAPPTTGRSPAAAARRLAVREVRTGAVVVAVAAAALVWAVVTTYTSLGVGDAAISQFADNPALRALFGVPHRITEPGGFTVWRAGSFVLVITGLWSLRTTTRVLRGEEDAGRWELLLSGPLQAGTALRNHLGVLAAACSLSGAAVATAFLVAGEPAAGSVLYGTAVALVAMLFGALGALLAQVFGQRRQATGVGGLVLGAAFAVRMLADGADGLGWLRWASPFGWAEEVRAFDEDRVGPLVLLAVAVALLGSGAMLAARRRDLGAGLVRTRDAAEPRTRLLGGLVGLAWRQRLAGLPGWVGGAAFWGLIMGGITASFTEFVRTDWTFRDAVGQLGFGAMTTPAGFVGTMFTFAAVIFALAAVLALHTLWEDEDEGRAELVVPQPLHRRAWLGAHVLAATALALATLLACGLATWAGVALSGEDLSVGDALAGAANTAPLVAAYLGLAVLLIGVRPAVGLPVGVGAVVGGFLLDLLGPVVGLPTWLIDVSPFAHLADVPAVGFDPASSLGLLAVGAVLAGAGTVAYAHRDLR